MTQKPRYELTDLDLAPMNRTMANHWKAKYFESYKELVNANKGIRRLIVRLERAETRCLDLSEKLIEARKFIVELGEAITAMKLCDKPEWCECGPMYVDIRICQKCGKPKK